MHANTIKTQAFSDGDYALFHLCAADLCFDVLFFGVLLVALAALLEPLLAGAAFVLTAFFAVVALVFDEAVFELEAL